MRKRRWLVGWLAVLLFQEFFNFWLSCFFRKILQFYNLAVLWHYLCLGSLSGRRHGDEQATTPRTTFQPFEKETENCGVVLVSQGGVQSTMYMLFTCDIRWHRVKQHNVLHNNEYIYFRYGNIAHHDLIITPSRGEMSFRDTTVLPTTNINSHRLTSSMHNNRATCMVGALKDVTY